MWTTKTIIPAVDYSAEVQQNSVENKENKLSLAWVQAIYKNETNDILNESLSWEVLKKSQQILSQWRMEIKLGELLNRFTINNSNTSAPGKGLWLTTMLWWPFTDTRIAA